MQVLVQQEMVAGEIRALIHGGGVMRMYVGVTDKDWFGLLREAKCDEVNFWKPGTGNFKALEPNDLFLFKLHAPYNFIVGGGFFVRFSILPTYLAWDSFGIKNGTRSLRELNERIQKYRTKNRITESIPAIGCIILTEPFFFDEQDWIPVPEDWRNSIVQGKTYNLDTELGSRLYDAVQERIKRPSVITAYANRYSEGIARHRLGQGAFRIMVTDAYHRRCAVTGEKTLPVLEAAHIKPYSEQGPHLINNGLLLRSDLHTLFDKGYITIDPQYRLDVSPRLHEDYGNGKDYYKYHGKELCVLPDKVIELPSKEFLRWHNENVFLG